jgi:hypothetical protein
VARDIIITAFATPAQGNLNAAGLRQLVPSDVEPIELFEDPPLVIVVDKASDPATGDPPPDWGGQGFAWAAQRYAAAGGGSILQGLLRQKAGGVIPRRIALIGFSAGNSFLSRVLASPQDAGAVDTVVTLDGMTFSKNSGNYVPQSFTPWVAFAERATGVLNHASGVSNPYLSPLMVNAHTHIAAAPGKGGASASSTEEAAEKLFWLVNERYWQQARGLSQSVVNDQARRQNEIKARLAQSLASLVPITVNCAKPPRPKTYTRLSPDLGYLGNLWSLDFGGVNEADHCMIAYVAQRAIFDAFLLPRWNARSEAVAGVLPMGDVAWTSPEPGVPGGGIVERGTFDTGIGATQIAVGVGIAALIAAGIILAPDDWFSRRSGG